jgi:hypothetical protein|tara:strand:+ start:3114 stop:5834 length:2721 start_codon:yes stop_codon:yes gene_type:complete
MKKDLVFDKFIYKYIINSQTDDIDEFLMDTTYLRKNEILLYCYDILPDDYTGYVTEINTNSAFDNDIVEWFDFKPIMDVVKKWKYENIILLINEKAEGKIKQGNWYREFQTITDKNKVNLRLKTVDPETDIFDFKYNKRKDLIVRIAWDKNCTIDKFAADKIAFKKYLNDFAGTSITAPYTEKPDRAAGFYDDIYEPNRWFVFKKRNIDRKHGVHIEKFTDKRKFLTRLSKYDYVEHFIDMEKDHVTGFNVEIKHYKMMFRKDYFNLTPNLYTQLWDYEERNNQRELHRVSSANLFYTDEVSENDTLVEQQFPHHFHYIKINDTHKFLSSASVLIKENNRGRFVPVHLLEVGDVLLKDGKDYEIKKLEVITERVRVKTVTNPQNVLHLNGFQISAKHENFVQGLDSIITNPFKEDIVLSSTEKEIVEATMAKAADAEMPERVVEITFELGGTYFTSEFLFEKPLKVINSMDYDIRMDRTDGLEPFGTHNEAGVERGIRDEIKPTFGWASYDPSLTYSKKRMEVMRLRPGMTCLTYKRPDMKVTTAIYGEMVPCKIVSMKEVVGKKSHWDIYDIKPTENYFMNALKVHNGPSQFDLLDENQVIGNYDAGNPQSFPAAGPTWYAMDSRLNADLTFHPAPSPLSSTPRPKASLAPIQGEYPNPEFSTVPLNTSYKGARLQRQPSNLYHAQVMFSSQYPMTVMLCFTASPYQAGTSWPPNQAYQPNSPTRRRLMGMATGANFDIAVYPNGPGARYYWYNGSQWAPSPYSAVWNQPAGNTAFRLYPSNPKVSPQYFSKHKFTYWVTDQSSPYYTVYKNYETPPANMQNSFNFPTPGTNPRSPSNRFAFGGNSYPNPSSSDGAYNVCKILIWQKSFDSADSRDQSTYVHQGHPNNGAYHEGGPQFNGGPLAP